jgi:signal transduction histidine kinase
MERILSGNEDGQWIELQGVVQEAFVNDEYPPGTGVMMMVSGHRCRVVSTSGMRQDPHELVDAEVLVRGVFAPDSNYRAEFAQPKLLISGLQNDFQIIKQPDADPFNAQRVELNRLLPFSPDAKPYHRKVVTGTVTFAVPGKFFFIESKGTGVRIDSPEIGIQCGRRVEVAGFVDTAFTFASLKNAIVRDLGPAPVPDPVRVTGAQLLDPSLRTNWGKPSATDFGGRSVKVRGTIRRVDWKEPMVPDALVIDVEGEAKKAFLPLGKSLAPGAVSKWIPGAKIEVSGICEYEFPFKGDIHGQYGPISFHLWVKDPGDVTILAQAPWWTPTRLLTALAGLAIALSAAIVWTVLLKTQVRTQTRIIQEKVRAETTNAERSRIARDLHDDLGANLTQIGLLSELTRRELEHPKRARELLDNVFDAAHALARQLDAAVWAINPSNDSLDSLVQYLCKYAQEFRSLADIRCRLDVAMDLPNYALSSLQRHNLFLAVKEAINNVVRHAGASIVILRVNIENNTSIFEIEDDGVGISEQPENEGHDGLGNMPLRMKQLGGEFFRMTGKGGKGTIIRLSMPLKNSNEQK